MKHVKLITAPSCTDRLAVRGCGGGVEGGVGGCYGLHEQTDEWAECCIVYIHTSFVQHLFSRCECEQLPTLRLKTVCFDSMLRKSGQLNKVHKGRKEGPPCLN